MTRSRSILIVLALLLVVGFGFIWWRGSPVPGPAIPPEAQHPPAPAGTPPIPGEEDIDPVPETVPPYAPSTPSLESPVDWQDVDELPRLTFRVRPEYPEDLRSEGLRAEVRLRLTIDTDGRVARVEVLESPHPAFEEPARTAALQFLFQPATRNGVPVPFAVETTVAFDPHR